MSAADEQRIRLQRAVDRACVEIDRETVALVLAFVAAEKRRRRDARIRAVAVKALALCAAVLAVLWALSHATTDGAA